MRREGTQGYEDAHQLDLHRVSLHSGEHAHSNSNQVFSINIPQIKKNWANRTANRGIKNRQSELSNPAARLTTISKFFKEPSDLGNSSTVQAHSQPRRSASLERKKSRSPIEPNRNRSLKKKKAALRATPSRMIAQMRDTKLKQAQEKIKQQNRALTVLKSQLCKQM